MAWLRAKVRGRANIVLLGSIGSSKTTAAETLIKEIPDWERLGTLESTPEWELDRRNWAPIRYAQERRPGIGLPTAEEALEMALRMRLDRVLFGELRNAEAWAWLRSLQTGLRGAIATAHGHPGFEGLFRALHPMIRQSPHSAAMDEATLRAMIHANIDVVLHCARVDEANDGRALPLPAHRGCAGAMNAALKALAEATLGTATVAAAWTAGASSAFLGIAGLWGHPLVPTTDYLWGWWRYLPHAGRNTTVALGLGLVLSAGAVAVPLLSLAILVARRRWRSIGGLRGVGQRLGQIRRASSNNHGQADWMTEARIDSLFPPLPHPEIGGVVVGERSRDDLTPEHALPFDPRDTTTWGLQGRGPLMFDHCERGTTHSLIIGGGGTYKSTTLTTTLLHWKPSAVILDPARELHAKLGQALADADKTVLRLDLGAAGPNVLDAIDLATPEGRLMADSRLRGVASRVIGPMPRDDSGNAGRFKRWGRAIVLALLADLVHRDDIPAAAKTLRELRRGLDVPTERLRDRLRGVYERSPSGLARSMAANVMDLPDETWGGAVGNAMDDTEWLATEAYAALVSGAALRMRDIVRGRHAIFVQIPQEVLQVTPSLARVLIGGLLDAVLAQAGRVVGRVGFFIDEAVLLGPEPSLKLARDQGRKSKVTLQLFYQSEGQIEDVWGKAQKDAWFDGVSFRSYTRVNTARTSTPPATSSPGERSAPTAPSSGREPGQQRRQQRTRPLEWASRYPARRQRAGERAGARADEAARACAAGDATANEVRITIVANDRPIRHGFSAIDFCRPEVAARLSGPDRLPGALCERTTRGPGGRRMTSNPPDAVLPCMVAGLAGLACRRGTCAVVRRMARSRQAAILLLASIAARSGARPGLPLVPAQCHPGWAAGRPRRCSAATAPEFLAGVPQLQPLAIFRGAAAALRPLGALLLFNGAVLLLAVLNAPPDAWNFSRATAPAGWKAAAHD